MNQDLIDDRALLDKFLHTWPMERVAKMKLPEYVGLNNHDTFCYWVETKTKLLGSINGVSSAKFEIFEYGAETPEFKYLLSDEKYAWGRKHGESSIKAFHAIRSHIIHIIEYAGRNEFEMIEAIPVHGFLKWKVAFLYSNEGFIPIFCRKDLAEIAKRLGMKVTDRTPMCDLHRFVFSTFDGESVYDYMRELYNKHNPDGANSEQIDPINRGRSATNHKNTERQDRKGSSGGVANQYHNELQNDLYERLSASYPEQVFMEKDFVDISVNLDDRKLLYEVKSDNSPIRCIREALGQLLQYAYKDESKKPVELIVYGKNKPDTRCETFIKYIQSILKVPFRYESAE